MNQVNPASILALISELYIRVETLRAEKELLEKYIQDKENEIKSPEAESEEMSNLDATAQ